MRAGIIISSFILFYLPTVIEGVATPRLYEADPLLEYKIFDEELYESILNNETCRRHREEMNGYPFYDVSFRSLQGLLRWNWHSLGDFSQCLKIKQELTANDVVEGKYCLFEIPIKIESILTGTRLPVMDLMGNISIENVKFDLDMDSLIKLNSFLAFSSTSPMRNSTEEVDESPETTLRLQFGLCMPKACSLQEVLNVLDVLNIEYRQVYCRVPNDKPMVAADYVAIVILSIIGLLTGLSTAYDIYYALYNAKDTKRTNPLLKTFSLYTNTIRLFDLATTGSLDCLDGIRSLSIFWVIIGHTFTSLITIRIANGLDIVEYSRDLSSLWVMSANNSVDTFFTIGGLLLVYASAKKMKPGQLLKNLHVFYLNRYLRMFPLLAIAVLLQASIFHRISDGANWDYEGQQVMYCRQYWWSALLHSQNIVNSLEACLPHTWYLSVDFQLHLISPLFLYWLLRGRKAAWVSTVILTIVANAATIYYVFRSDFISMMWQVIFKSREEMDRYTIYFYNNTLTRIPPFFIGMSFGYLLHMTRGTKVRLSKWVVCTGYMLSGTIFIITIYVANVVVRPDVSTQLMDNIINSFTKPAWAFSLCWLIYACVNGYGGPVNWFLSLKIFKFIARISYAMYIFHYPIQYIKAGAYNTPFMFNLGNIFNSFTSDLWYTFMVSIAMCILIDSPFSTLIKFLLEGTPKKPRPEKRDELKEKPGHSELEGDGIVVVGRF